MSFYLGGNDGLGETSNTIRFLRFLDHVKRELDELSAETVWRIKQLTDYAYILRSG
jgi:hypothetical protein